MQEIAEKIHLAALELLDNPGIRMEHEGTRRLLLNAGAGSTTEKDVIRIPGKMVEECIALCPEEVHLADRHGGGKHISSHSAASIWSVPGMNMLKRGKRRRFTSKDMADIARLMEQLDEVDGVFGLAMADVPPHACDIIGLRIMAENTCKHIRVLCSSPEGAECMLAMKDVIGDYPWFSMGFTAHGPLRWTALALEIFARSAGKGIPVTINGEPMAGVSGPVTIAGSAAVGNAEILAGIIVNQLLEPGRPCIYNLGLAHTFDMRTSIAVTGGPENALYAKLSAAMGRFYNLPSASWVSTESMTVDAQSAMEKMFGFQTHLASGINNIWSVGQVESELTISPAQAVIDNEMISYVKRYQRGVEVTEETLALQTIRQVGITGSFLETMHTAEHFREEFFMPAILNRKTHDTWQAEGSRDLTEIAEERAEELMAKPVTDALTPEQSRELESLTNSFLKEQVNECKKTP